MAIRRRVADKQHRWLSQVDLSEWYLASRCLPEAAPAGFRNLEKRELRTVLQGSRNLEPSPRHGGGRSEAQWDEFVLEQLLSLAQTRWQVGAGIASRFVVALSQQRETLRQREF